MDHNISKSSRRVLGNSIGPTDYGRCFLINLTTRREVYRYIAMARAKGTVTQSPEMHITSHQITQLGSTTYRDRSLGKAGQKALSGELRILDQIQSESRHLLLVKISLRTTEETFPFQRPIKDIDL